MVRAKTKAIAVGLGLLVVFSLIGIVIAYEQVPEGHEGVQKEWGAVNGNLHDSGANWVVPVAQSIQNVEVRPRTYTMSQTQSEGDKSRADAINVKTVNGSTVAVDITVRYHIDSERADQFVAEWNDERQMETRLIRPTIRSVLRDEASSLETTGEDAIYTQSGRQALEETAIKALRTEFEGQPIVLEAVQIRNIDLPDQIDSTLDEKEQAKQRVEVEREKINQEEARAEQRRVQAQADADVIRTKGQALRENPEVLQLRYIEALKNGETVYVPTDGGMVLTKDIGTDGGSATNQTVVP